MIELDDIRMQYVKAMAQAENYRRERLVEWALWTCAFLNELHAVQDADDINSWRLW